MFLKELPTERQEKQVDTTPPTASGFDKALELFRKAADEIPAYRDFLKKNKLDPSQIRTTADFCRVPIVTKDNYLKKYSLEAMQWKDESLSARIISTSSGSSGQPFFWPRGNQSIDDSIIILDGLLDDSFQTKSRSTLCINAFAMGTWIAGTYMTSAMWRLSDLGHKIVTITPGITKEEIVKEIQILGPQFQQIILMGYPPFVKDVIDYAESKKIKLKRSDIKCIFAGENYSEQWRDYVLERIGKTHNPSATLGIYGTADAGIMAMESPWSVFIRRQAIKNRKLYKEIFGDSSLIPTLVQYDPSIRYVEEVDGKVIFTINNSLPLIRYEILDKGKTILASEMRSIFSLNNIKIPSKYSRYVDTPFIALYGREDVAAIFYALNIYPENIKYGLEQKSLRGVVTGKFVAQSQFHETTQEQSLHIEVEVCKGIPLDQRAEKKIFRAILSSLIASNGEFSKLHEQIGKKAEPIIHLKMEGDDQFKINIKQRWIKKS